jgi:TP901 family phage tail tape measure protein
MALENVGLGGVLTFNGSAAISGMNQAAVASRNLANSQTNLQSAVAKSNSGYSKLGAAAFFAGARIATAPIEGAFDKALSDAANFESQLGAVGAVANATAEEMGKLESAAFNAGFDKMGFNATQAAKAEEELARAGFTANESVDALGGVMAAAAADNIGLDTSARIVSSTLRGLGLEASQSGRVADVLAKTSAASATDIVGLGESMKYAVSQARVLGIDLETTAAMLGALSDAGLRGSIGGTSFTNMLQKMSRPSEKAAKFLQQNNIAMKTFADGSFDVIGTTSDIVKALDGMNNVIDKSSITYELFGMRGMKAFGAIEASMKAMDESGRPRFDALLDSIKNSQGEAERMASRRIDNFNGAMTQLKNTVMGFNIVTMGQLLAPFTSSIREATQMIAGFAKVIFALTRGTMSGKELVAEYGETVVAVAIGVREGIQAIADAWMFLTEQIRSAIDGLGNPTIIKDIAKWATILFMVAAAVGPIIVAMGMLAFLVTSVVLPGLEALASVVSGVFLPVLGAVVVVFLAMRREGESFGSVVMRMFTAVGQVASFVWNEILGSFLSTMVTSMGGIDNLKATWNIFANEAIMIFKTFVGGVIRGIQGLGMVMRVIMSAMGAMVGNFVGGAGQDFRGFAVFVTNIMTAVAQAVLSVFETVLKALQKMLGPALDIAEFTGLAKGSEFWANVAYFTSQEFDLTGQLQANINAAESLGTVGGVEAQAQTDGWNAMLDGIQGMSTDLKTAGRNPKVNVGIDLEDKRQLEVNNCLQVNGRQMALAQAQHRQEINERAGFRATPWQRRQIMEQGAAPVPSGGSF